VAVHELKPADQRAHQDLGLVEAEPRDQFGQAIRGPLVTEARPPPQGDRVIEQADRVRTLAERDHLPQDVRHQRLIGGEVPRTIGVGHPRIFTKSRGPPGLAALSLPLSVCCRREPARAGVASLSQPGLVLDSESHRELQFDVGLLLGVAMAARRVRTFRTGPGQPAADPADRCAHALFETRRGRIRLVALH
jgi:hypothetical protein